MLVDNHITEEDPAFMTHFDPRTYVSLIKKAGVEASMAYACDHNGNCYYPTVVGHMHRNLKGRDLFGETTALLRQVGIHPIAYYTTVYHNHSAKNHPAWRMQDAAGRQHDGRYWWSCPNNPAFVAFTLAQLGEIIAYDVDGIFVDMTFWPIVCCCPNCREAFLMQTGWEIPPAVDWNDPQWVAFQRFREQSMAAFCQAMAGFIKSKKDMTVTFQNSPIIFGWSWGQSPAVADSCDYTSGDFYGGKYQHVLGAKILAAASKNQPFEYMTSRCVDLRDHTSMKSEAELMCEASTTLANGGAYFFIDAINPDGSLNEAVYERLGRVSARLAPFTQKVEQHRPVLTADTALYFSMASFIDPALNGKPLRDLEPSPTFSYASTPHYDELLGTSILLTRAHWPFKIVRAAQGDLGAYQTLVINNAMVMSSEEVEKVRAFVSNGGTLVATSLTSLWRPDGSTSGDFALADVFGVSYSGKLSRRINYLKLPGEQNLVSCNRPAPLVKLAGASPLAGLDEPLFDPDDLQHYASIHSNPLGRSTGCVGLAVNAYGKGRCLYLAPPVLALQQAAQESFGAWLLQEYAPPSLVVHTNAPAAVEITLLRSTTSSTWLLGLVNYQKELPNIPVQDFQVAVRLPIGVPRGCACVSNHAPLPFTFEDGILSIKLPFLETLELVEIAF
jgi:hypothetical protein